MPFDIANRQIKNTKDEILAELQYSLRNNNAIAILVRDTHELITTAVVGITADDAEGEFVINLMDEDLHGYPLDRPRLLLSNIERIIHFDVAFDDPQYVKVRRKEKFKV